MKQLKLIPFLAVFSILVGCKTEVDRNPTYKESNPLTDSTLDVGRTVMSAPTNWVEFRRTKVGKSYTKTLNYKADRNFSFAIGKHAAVSANNCKSGSNKDFQLTYKIKIKSITSKKFIELTLPESEYSSPRIHLNMDDKLKMDITLKSNAECSTVLTSFYAFES